MKILLILGLCILSGCAGAQHQQCIDNLNLLDKSYANKEVDTVTYLKMKIQIQQYCNQYTFQSRMSRGLSAAGSSWNSNHDQNNMPKQVSLRDNNGNYYYGTIQ